MRDDDPAPEPATPVEAADSDEREVYTKPVIVSGEAFEHVVLASGQEFGVFDCL